MLISENLEMFMVWKNMPDDKDKKKCPEVVASVKFWDCGKNVTYIPIQNEKHLMERPDRVKILEKLPTYFSFSKHNLVLIKKEENAGSSVL